MQENEELNVPDGEQQLDLNLGESEGAEIEISEEGEAQIKEASSPEINENSSKKPEDDTSEHEEYSTRVKKRLDKMTAKLREAERREQAALEYARQIQANLQQVQTQAQNLDAGYVTEYRNRVDSQLAIAEANLQDAVERGDGRAVVEAQKLLSKLVMEQQRAEQLEAQRAQPQRTQAQQVAQTQQVAQPQRPPARPDPKAESWAEKNEWFGSDRVMTHAAFGIHSELAEEGFDLTSDEYYDELDKRIRKEFPHKFKKPSQVNDSISAPNVAPASRASSTGANGRRTIKLTPSEVAIAKKLGVPLEEYAKYVRR
jgi:hypothetical protein